MSFDRCIQNKTIISAKTHRHLPGLFKRYNQSNTVAPFRPTDPARVPYIGLQTLIIN